MTYMPDWIDDIKIDIREDESMSKCVGCGKNLGYILIDPNRWGVDAVSVCNKECLGEARKVAKEKYEDLLE